VVVYLIVIRQTENLASVQADKKVMIVLDAMLVCRCFRALAVEISAAD
jgi:hypothetical protein